MGKIDGVTGFLQILGEQHTTEGHGKVVQDCAEV